MTSVENQVVSHALVDEEVDLKEFVLAIWRRRLLIAAITVAGTSLSIVYAMLAPSVYKSSVLLIPTESPKSDQLGAAAALFGSKKGGGAGDLDLYQSLLKSRTVISKLLKTHLTNYTDTNAIKSEALSQILKVDTLNPKELSFALKTLQTSINVEIVGIGSGGILEVTASASTPWLAQQIADTVVGLGQEAIRAVRLERSAAISARLNMAANQAKEEWYSSNSAVTRYRDRNRSVILPDQILEFDRLNMERQVMEQKYLLARKEYEQHILDQEKTAPPTLVLDHADYPPQRSKPVRKIIALIGALSSFSISCIIALILHLFSASINTQVIPKKQQHS